MDADSPLDPRFLPDAVKGAENRGLSDEGLVPSHHKRGERFPLQQQVPFLRSTFFCTYAGGSGGRQDHLGGAAVAISDGLWRPKPWVMLQPGKSSPCNKASKACFR